MEPVDLRRGMTRTQLLESAPAHTMTDLAWLLALVDKNGEPRRRAAIRLCNAGKLKVVDDTAPVRLVTTEEIRRYLSEGPRRPELERRKAAAA